MQHGQFFTSQRGLPVGRQPGARTATYGLPASAAALAAFPRQVVIGMILVVALLAFEVFNFDTTRFALRDLLGAVSFVSVEWATILAIAFCAIDFAGLAQLFTPERGADEPKEVWYLMGAWLLGATMNAIMTWWAVSLTLLNHNLGNEVLSREQLLQGVPIFVAVLVWLTRILFIGAFTVAGDHLFRSAGIGQSAAVAATGRPSRPAMAAQPRPAAVPHTSDEVPGFLRNHEPGAWPPLPSAEERTVPVPRPARGSERTRQRPPMPGLAQTLPLGAQGRSRRD